VWSVASILVGLQSFMAETSQTVGSVETTVAEKLRLAAASMEYNKTNKDFCRLFPELVARYEQARAAAAAAGAPAAAAGAAGAGAGAGAGAATGAGAGTAAGAAAAYAVAAPPRSNLALSLCILLVAIFITFFLNR
jgi:hypothetical protein